jgi:hypothetical protein
LIVLPLREETYDNHRHEPPLDTALKDLVFRIEPPLFQHVLTRRIQLALSDIESRVNTKRLSYTLPNGIRVDYPVADQAFYLTSILHSLYEHDFYLRRMIVGLAGRNIRQAMEVFLEVCHSAHITADEIFKIRQSEGLYVLPLSLVARVLLRINRRFYDGETAYIKNVFSTKPSDPYPNYFTRLLILRWLQKRFKNQGPTGIVGYNRVITLKEELVVYGLSEQVLDREILFLLKSQCIVAEHLRVDSVADDDLIRLAPAGFVHLESLEIIDYLAAIAEDTWYSDINLAQQIADRIGSNDHYGVTTAVRNARDLVNYLLQQKSKSFPSPKAFVNDKDIDVLLDLSLCDEVVKRAEKDRAKKDRWFAVENRFEVGKDYIGVIVNRTDFGLFVELYPGVVGLAHRSKLPRDFYGNDDFMPGEEFIVSILNINLNTKRIELAPARKRSSPI